MTPRGPVPPADYEELRIALVMNGGVSLAVWIGGVTHEINRAMRCEELYGELLDLTATTARVDVISGTSAGGINGALLALARAYDVDLAQVRSLWLNSGSLDRLLHTPYDRTASSLLQGNTRFFDDLRAAFSDIQAGGAVTAAADAPIDLTLTTTMLRGVPNQRSDDLGVAVNDVTHRGRFEFRRGEQFEQDPFADETIAQRLALAARATASFPVAFEPLFCPIGPQDGVTDVRLLDMHGIASFEKSRFLVDGGILDNKPLEAAIDAVLRQRATREVRRVLAYVVPAPGQTSADLADRMADVPNLGTVALASLIELPRAESISAQLEAIFEHNRSARRKRDTRIALIRELGPQGMDSLAASLFTVYRRRRAEGAAEYIGDELAIACARAAAAPVTFGRRRREWIGQLFLSLPRVPWVPDALPTADALRRPDALQRWQWGAYAIEHIAEIVFDLFRRALIASPLRWPADPALRTRLKDHYAIVFEVVAALPRRRRGDQAFWGRLAKPLADILAADPARLVADAQNWAAHALDEWSKRQTTVTLSSAATAYSGGRLPAADIPVTQALGGLAGTMASLLAASLDDIAAAGRGAARTARTPQEREAADDLVKYAGYFGSDRTPAAVLARLLALEVVQYSTGAHHDVPEQLLEFVQISADTPNAFGGASLASDKLAGAQLANFGGFYKKAWRANDWMYGRMDGADRLARILLNPARLSRLYPGDRGAVLDALHAIAVPASLGQDEREWLERHWKQREALITGELAFLEEPEIPIPEQLPHTMTALVARMHLAIIREDLRVVCQAAQDDRRGGAGRTGPSADLIAAATLLVGDDPTRWDTLPAKSLVGLFKECRIGQERFSGEIGTDLFTSTLTRSLAVGTSMLAGRHSGLGWLGRVLNAVRLPMLVIDALAQNAVSTSRSAAFASGVVVTFGASVVVLLLLTAVSVPFVIAWVGSLAFVMSIALSLRRHPRLSAWWLGFALLVWFLAAIMPDALDYVRARISSSR